MKERSDADTVAHQHEAASRPIPQGDRELPVEIVDEVQPALFIEMHDRFGVAVRAKRVAAFYEVLTQLDVVEDLAVERDPDRAVFVAQRLLARAQVDDGQAAMTQPDAGLDVIALLVRPTVQQRASHAPQCLVVDRALVLMPDSCYAAH